MNCDQVFDILTCASHRIEAKTKTAIQSHLSGCDDCRLLAEEMRPAVELLRRSTASSDDLSEHQVFPTALWTSDRPEPKGASVLDASPAALGSARLFLPERTEPRQLVVKCLIASAVCAMCWVLGARSVATLPEQRGTTVPPLASLSATGAIDREVVVLANLLLPDPCQTSSEGQPMASVCCTQCHSSAVAKRPRIDDLTTFWAACLACHSNAESALPRKVSMIRFPNRSIRLTWLRIGPFQPEKKRAEPANVGTHAKTVIHRGGDSIVTRRDHSWRERAVLSGLPPVTIARPKSPRAVISKGPFHIRSAA